MLIRKFITASAIAAAVIFGLESSAAAKSRPAKHEVAFTVRVENIASKDGLTAVDGTKYPFALSPGFYAVAEKAPGFFTVGGKASAELEAQAEDGDPDLFNRSANFANITGSFGIFNKPVGSSMASPILPDGVYEFTFTASKGMKLNLLTMFGQSNDLFYAPAKAINLFDENGKPVTGDVTGLFELWDAGTEVNQAPGIGPDQGPRQKMKNQGAAENGVVRLVNDGFVYPNTKDVLRVTITAK